MANPPPSPSPSPSASTSTFSPPSSILVVGSGVFGLSTALALARRHVFAHTSITVVDRAVGALDGAPAFPARDASSVDSSRIIRSDYADPAYAALAAEAQSHWRKADGPHDLGAEGRYAESGLILVADGVPPHLAPGPSGGATPSQQQKARQRGMDYVHASWQNAVALAGQDPSLAGQVRELPDTEAIRDAIGTGGISGNWGYLNGCAGWADAGKSMAWLYERVRELRRVEFVGGTVTSLVHSEDTVTGVQLSDGRRLSAELVILATGAWTASLLNLSGQATATGQVLAYMDLSEEEQGLLGKMPTLLNLTSGHFIITPANRILKIARHAYGYLSPTPLPGTPLASPPSGSEPSVVSYPRTFVSDPDLSIPEAAAVAMREALREMVPLPALRDRPFTKTRLCWYTDTASGDFIISHHPRYRGLFVATGGSGHGFKFLPVIGEKIVDTVEGRCPAAFREKWAWKGTNQVRSAWDPVCTEDGSRGGEPGLLLRNDSSRCNTWD